MKLEAVSDLSFALLDSSSYEGFIFASGYERRSTTVARQLDRVPEARVEVLAFNEEASVPRREANDEYFTGTWLKELTPASSSDDQAIIQTLRSWYADGDAAPKRLLVDYSSMPRMWYWAVIDFLLDVDCSSPLTIDFVYSVGDHNEYADPLVISSVTPLPGLEGRTVNGLDSSCIFGLGFDDLAALCVLDYIEPESVITFYADPAAFDDYPEKVLARNSFLIDNHSRLNVGLPLSSVSTTFRYLIEIAEREQRQNVNVLIVPMGPKPHVLASLLACVCVPRIGCFHVRGFRESPEDVGSTDEIVATRVVFSPDSPRKT